MLADLPAPFKPHLIGLALRIDDWPDEETLAAFEIDSPYGLLGLYRGVNLFEKADGGGSAEDVDMIHLYRMPLLDAWIHGEDSLEDLIRNTLIHEIGHHFGFSDDDMEVLEDNA